MENEIGQDISIKTIFADADFTDRYLSEPDAGVDVIIPIIHTNELWRSNLNSIYREIPVKRLLISDGGCIDTSLEILKGYPRVEIFNHKDYRSLGYCLKKLIEEVKTEHFVYLHSDVYLPPGWYDAMASNKSKFDWYESRQINTFLVDLPINYNTYNRPLSGGQIGRKAAFDKILPIIEDDYLYRNEDLIFADLIKRSGGKYGQAENAYLYHQIMNKKSKWRRTIADFSIRVDKSIEEEIREFDFQARGLIKYTEPDIFSRGSVLQSINRLKELNRIDLKEFNRWVLTTPNGQKWIKLTNARANYFGRIKGQAKAIARNLLSVGYHFKELFKIIIGF